VNELETEKRDGDGERGQRRENRVAIAAWEHQGGVQTVIGVLVTRAQGADAR
jgi:hypothetical protein